MIGVPSDVKREKDIPCVREIVLSVCESFVRCRSFPGIFMVPASYVVCMYDKWYLVHGSGVIDNERHIGRMDWHTSSSYDQWWMPHTF